MSSRVIPALTQFFDKSGSPLSYGSLEFLESETTDTLKATYADIDLTIINTNPVQLDGEGRCPNIFGSGAYNVILRDKNGVQIDQRDPVIAQGQISLSGQFLPWSTEITYTISDIVIGSDDRYYRSTVVSNIGNDPTLGGDEWQQVFLQKDWNTNDVYAIDDPVIYEGKTYVSITDGNQGNEPPDATNWIEQTTDVAQFGLGTALDTLLLNQNLDDVILTGFYTGFGGNNPNASTGDNPFPSKSGGFTLRVEKALDDSSSNVNQFATLITDITEDQITLQRSKTTGNWTDWDEINLNKYNNLSDLNNISTARINLGLGTAAVEDVTTSATDNTAGRLTKVGDGGLLGPSIDYTALDLLSVTTPQFLHSLNGTNAPSIGNGFFSGVSMIMQNTNNMSLFGAVNNFNRWVGNVKSGGSWNGWDTFYTSRNLLGTVSESSGVPTGAVIERGSNANGEYVKFADGTMICQTPYSLQNATNVAIGNIFRSNSSTWIFPVFFSSTLISTYLTVGNTTNPDYWGIAHSPTTTQCSIQAFAASATSSTISNAKAIAIGRWF